MMWLVRLVLLIIVLYLLLLCIYRPTIIYNVLAAHKIKIKEAAQKKREKQIIAAYYLKTHQDNFTIKYFYLKHCFYRVPYSFLLLQRMWLLIKDEFNKDELSATAERELIQDMDQALKKYRQNALINDINKVEHLEQELEEKSSEVLTKLRQEEYKIIEARVELLAAKIKTLITTNNQELLSEINELDQLIDQKSLRGKPALKEQYEQCSKLFAEYLAQQDESRVIAEKEKKYNLTAVENHKEALELFTKSKGLFSDINHLLDEIVYLIGGWDVRYLLPPAQVYTNQVYMAIFTKLKADDQIKLTSKMVKKEKRSLEEI